MRQDGYLLWAALQFHRISLAIASQNARLGVIANIMRYPMFVVGEKSRLHSRLAPLGVLSEIACFRKLAHV
jgi:hypothetical protein